MFFQITICRPISVVGENSVDTFLTRFDTDWKRYNRDLIRKVQEYQKEMGDAQ